MLKVIAYLIYVAVFTYCYYGLNKKLSTLWILTLYPLIFVAAIYPIKLWVDYARPVYGDAFASTWAKIVLMMFASFIVFNWMYVAVNFMVDAQVNFHQKYNKANIKGFLKSTLDNGPNIKTLAHFFFYTGSLILMYIAVEKY